MPAPARGPPQSRPPPSPPTKLAWSSRILFREGQDQPLKSGWAALEVPTPPRRFGDRWQPERAPSRRVGAAGRRTDCPLSALALRPHRTTSEPPGVDSADPAIRAPSDTGLALS